MPPQHRVVPARLSRRSHQICVGMAAEITGPAGLTPVEFAVPTALNDAPDMDRVSLALRLGVDPVSAHNPVQRLAALGRVDRRVKADDRRARVLRLSPQGQAVHDDLRPR